MNDDNHARVCWYSLDEAADRLHTTSLNVLMHIKRGLLVGVERDGAWRIEPASLEELLRKQGKGQVPAVCQSGCAKKAGGCSSCS